MSVSDVEHVVRCPAIIEAVRPYSRHTSLGHLFDFVIGKQVPFVDDDWIEPRVIGTRAGRGVKKGHRLVQIVQNRRMKFQESLHLITRERQRHAQPVAIIVVGDVMAPVNQRRHTFAWIRFAIVVGINHSVAASHLERGSN